MYKDNKVYIVKIEKGEQIIYQQAKDENELNIRAVITAVNKVKRQRKLKIDSIDITTEKRSRKKKITEPETESKYSDAKALCSNCKKEVSSQDVRHSIKTYGDVFCVECQPKV